MSNVEAVSRWQRKQLAAGRCKRCGQPRIRSLTLCDKCLNNDYEKSRALVIAGNCSKCGQPRNLYANFCDKCHGKLIERMRKRQGSNPWEPGKAGQHPLALTKGLGLTKVAQSAEHKKCVRCCKPRTLYDDFVCLPCILDDLGTDQPEEATV